MVNDSVNARSLIAVVTLVCLLLTLLIIAILGAVDVWLSAAASASDPAAASAPPVGGGSHRIAFLSDLSGDNALYVMNTDGSGLTHLTQNIDDLENICCPVWLP